MQVRIELFPILAWVESLKSMLLESLHQYGLCHFQPIVQIRQLFVGLSLPQLLWRYGAEGSVKVIDAFTQVLGEARYGEVAGGLNVAFCAVLKVAKVCYRTEVSVLDIERVRLREQTTLGFSELGADL